MVNIASEYGSGGTTYQPPIKPPLNSGLQPLDNYQASPDTDPTGKQYNIQKFLWDNQRYPADAIQTLRDKGFSQSQISAAAHANVQLAQDLMTLNRKTYPSNLWQAVTPWNEGNDETIIDGMRQYFERLGQGGSYSQADLKAEYEAEQAAKRGDNGALARVFAYLGSPDGSGVFYDSKTNTYRKILGGGAPMVGLASPATAVGDMGVFKYAGIQGGALDDLAIEGGWTHDVYKPLKVAASYNGLATAPEMTAQELSRYFDDVIVGLLPAPKAAPAESIINAVIANPQVFTKLPPDIISALAYIAPKKPQLYSSYQTYLNNYIAPAGSALPDTTQPPPETQPPFNPNGYIPAPPPIATPPPETIPPPIIVTKTPVNPPTQPPATDNTRQVLTSINTGLDTTLESINKSNQMIQATINQLEARNNPPASSFQPAPAPIFTPPVEAPIISIPETQPIIKTEIQPITKTQTATKTDIKPAVKTKPLVKVQPVILNRLETTPLIETRTQVQTQTQTQTQPETQTDTQTSTQTQLDTQTKDDTGKGKTGGGRLPLPNNDKQPETRDEWIAAYQGAIGFKQGFGWWFIKAPYRSLKEDGHFFYGEIPPAGMQAVEGGAGAAYRSIQALGGNVPDDLFLSLGIENIRIHKPDAIPGGTGTITFTQAEDIAHSHRATLKRKADGLDFDPTARYYLNHKLDDSIQANI